MNPTPHPRFTRHAWPECSRKRFASVGGSLFENVCGQMIERDPYELRRTAEQWMRAAVEREHTDLPRARLYARNADEALMALSVWREQKRAACGVDPFAEERAA